MLTELRLTNFKAFGETQRVPIKPLTLIFGANSSGKSSIIHSLLLANHAAESGSFDLHSPRLAGGMVDLGGFRNYVFRHDQNHMVSLHFESEINRKLLYEAEALVGTSKEEMVSFLRFSRFGLELRWGAKAKLEQIGVKLDGRAVVDFSRLENGEFRCVPLPGFLDALAHEVHRMLAEMDWDRWRRENSFKLPSRLGDWLAVTDLGEGKKPSQEQLENLAKAKEEQHRLEAEYERVRAEHLQNFKPLPEHLVAFAKVLKIAAQESDFGAKGFIVQSQWPRGLGGWPSLQGQITERCESDGVWGRFSEFVSLDDKDIESADWPSTYWPAAHALLFTLINLAQFCSAQIAKTVGKIGFLGPLREVPSRYFTETVNEQTSSPFGASVWAQLASRPELLEDVNRWLNGTLRCDYKVEIRRLLDEGGRERGVFPEFLDLRSQTTLSHRDLGFGMSQVLPVLVEAAANKGRLIAVEQPELHLHPAQQAELGDVFIESALGERKNTFLLETHSEHLILRILRRIRETTAGPPLAEGLPAIRPEDVAVLYVRPTEKGSVVLELPVTPDGDFAAPWPDGFFPERAKELF